MAKKQEILDKRFELYERAHTKEYYAVAKWLSEVKFQPAILGADQADVWRKLEKLCELYEAALDAERARNAKLERKLRSVSAAKRGEMPGKTEHTEEHGPQNPAPGKSVVPQAQKTEPVVQMPVKAELVKEEFANQAVAKVSDREPPKKKPVSQEEEVLQDLLREFGAGGGNPSA